MRRVRRRMVDRMLTVARPPLTAEPLLIFCCGASREFARKEARMLR